MRQRTNSEGGRVLRFFTGAACGLGVGFLALLGCREAPAPLHNYRFEFSGTEGIEGRGYWIEYGPRENPRGTTREFLVQVPDTLLTTALGIKTFCVRKVRGEGTLYVDIFKDGEQVLEEWTSQEMGEITYSEPDPIER